MTFSAGEAQLLGLGCIVALLTVHWLPPAGTRAEYGGCCLSPGQGKMGAAHREQMGHRLEHPVSEQNCISF